MHVFKAEEISSALPSVSPPLFHGLVSISFSSFCHKWLESLGTKNLILKTFPHYFSPTNVMAQMKEYILKKYTKMKMFWLAFTVSIF